MFLTLVTIYPVTELESWQYICRKKVKLLSLDICKNFFEYQPMSLVFWIFFLGSMIRRIKLARIFSLRFWWGLKGKRAANTLAYCAETCTLLKLSLSYRFMNSRLLAEAIVNSWTCTIKLFYCKLVRLSLPDISPLVYNFRSKLHLPFIILTLL